MRVTGYDTDKCIIRLPENLDEYYSGAAKRFLNIERICIEDIGKLSAEGEVIRGDFALLKAFLADHDRDLYVSIISENKKCELLFSAYSYDFVEDTFARAIHHKIEGVGYALRECVGKYEIRIREYDRLFSKVVDADKENAAEMALRRLKSNINLSQTHKEKYAGFIKENDLLVLRHVLGSKYDRAEFIAYLTAEKLLSKKAVREVLPELNSASEAEYVSRLLAYISGSGVRTRKGAGRLSL